MHIGQGEEKIQDELQRELDALEDELLPQEYEKGTYKPHSDAKHCPLPKTETLNAEIEEMIEVKVLRGPDEIIDEHLAEMMPGMIPRVLSKSFQERSKARSIMGNIVDIALTRSIRKRCLDDFIGEHLTSIVNREDIIHVMTNKVLGNQVIIVPVARFVEFNI